MKKRRSLAMTEFEALGIDNLRDFDFVELSDEGSILPSSVVANVRRCREERRAMQEDWYSRRGELTMRRLSEEPESEDTGDVRLDIQSKLIELNAEIAGKLERLRQLEVELLGRELPDEGDRFYKLLAIYSADDQRMLLEAQQLDGI